MRVRVFSNNLAYYTYETVDTGEDDGDLDLDLERLVLALLYIDTISIDLISIPMDGRTKQLGETGTTRQEEASGRVEIGTELRERSDFTVLSEVKLKRPSEFLHDLAAQIVSTLSHQRGMDVRLRSGPDTRHTQTNVDSRPDTTEEQLSLQEDLTVRDRDDVGRDVRRHVSSLSLDDGKGGKGSSTELVVHLRGTLEETRV